MTPSAPPPPAEVKIRTMKSDLASMAKSGGGLPTFETVRLNDSRVSQASPGASGKPKTLVIIIAAVAVVAVVLIGYVAYLFLKK